MVSDNFPPLKYLLSILGTNYNSLVSRQKVSVDSDALLQVIALASLSQDAHLEEISPEQIADLESYLKLARPPKFQVDETWYLENYPDVAAAIQSGAIPNSEFHFEHHGLLEWRAPNSGVLPLLDLWRRKILIKWRLPNIGDGEVFVGATRAANTLFDVGGGREFNIVMECLPYYRWRDTYPARETFISTVMGRFSDFSDRQKAFFLCWLMANRDYGWLSAFAPSIDEIDDISVLPPLARALDGVSHDIPEMEKIRGKVLDRLLSSTEFECFCAGEVDLFAQQPESVNAAELAGRYRGQFKILAPPSAVRASVGLPKRHIFVGYFGQLRFPDVTLPSLTARMKEEFPDSDLTFAVSTWDRSGARSLDDDLPFRLISEQMPDQFGEFLQTVERNSIADIAKYFPSIVQCLRARAAGSPSVGHDLIRALVGTDVLVNIRSDEEFMNGVATNIQARFAENGDMLNQGRMWNRIAALSQLLRVAEQINGTVDDVVMMRSDLRIGGQIGSIAKMATSAANENAVWADYDPLAEYIGGVGDRIFIMKRHMADVLLAAESAMQDILSGSDDRFKLYETALGAHKFPQTLLYQNSALIKRILPEDVPVSIYRGRLTLSELAEEISRDVTATQDPRARDFLTNLITGGLVAPV